MELIRSDLSSNAGAALANALILDLEEMGLIQTLEGFSVSMIMLDKSKIDRQKNKVKVKSDIYQSAGVENLTCIGLHGKVDKNTFKYDQVEVNGEIKIKKSKGDEHHLTFNKESGPNSGTYLTHRVVPLKGATGALCARETKSTNQPTTIYLGLDSEN